MIFVDGIMLENYFKHHLYNPVHNKSFSATLTKDSIYYTIIHTIIGNHKYSLGLKSTRFIYKFSLNLNTKLIVAMVETLDTVTIPGEEPERMPDAFVWPFSKTILFDWFLSRQKKGLVI